MTFNWQSSCFLCALFVVSGCPFPLRMQIMGSYTCQAFRKQILKAFLWWWSVVAAAVAPGKVKVSVSSVVL